MKIITCKDLGITGTDADLVMGNSEFMRLCEAGEREAAYSVAFAILNPPIEPLSGVELEKELARREAKIRDDQAAAAAAQAKESGLLQSTVPRHPKDRINGDGTITIRTSLSSRTMPIAEWMTFIPENPTSAQLAAARGNAILNRK